MECQLQPQIRSVPDTTYQAILSAVSFALCKLPLIYPDFTSSIRGSLALPKYISEKNVKGLHEYFLRQGGIDISLGTAETLFLEKGIFGLLRQKCYDIPQHEPEKTIIPALLMLIADASKGAFRFTSDSYALTASCDLFYFLREESHDEKTEIRLEAAQYIWETFLQLRESDDTFADAFDRNGIDSMRIQARDLRLIDACNTGLKLMIYLHNDIQNISQDYVYHFVKTCVDPSYGLKQDWARLLQDSCEEIPVISPAC